MYLTYIDPFTEVIIYLVFQLILIIAFVFWTGKGFAWLINQVFDLNNEKTFTKKNYDNVQD